MGERGGRSTKFVPQPVFLPLPLILDFLSIAHINLAPLMSLSFILLKKKKGKKYVNL